MSSFTAINFNSDSDSDDEDFVPDNTEALDSGERATGTKVALNKKKCKLRKGGIQLENDFDRAAVEALEKVEEKRRKEFEDDKEQKKHLVESKRTEDLWADFKKDTAPPRSSGSSSSSKRASNGIGKSGVSTSAKPKPKSSVPSRKKSSQSVISSIFDAFEKKDTEKLDQLTRSTGNEPHEAKGVVNSIFEDEQMQSKEELGKPGKTSEKQPEADGSKVKVTQVFDFAGESIEVSKHVDADSKEGQRFLQQQEKANKKRQPLAGGLGSIVNAIAKRPKMGCLDKSKMDWDKFVKEEGIKEDLETFNKGKSGYVEKQMFLERCDHRRFELEKGAREKTRQPLHR